MRTVWYCLALFGGIAFAFNILKFIFCLLLILGGRSSQDVAIFEQLGAVIGTGLGWAAFRYLYDQREKAHWAKIEERQTMTQTDA